MGMRVEVGGISLPEEMADMLCGFNYLVYGLREGVAAGGLFVFIQHRNQKFSLIKIYLTSLSGSTHLVFWNRKSKEIITYAFFKESVNLLDFFLVQYTTLHNFQKHSAFHTLT